MAVISANTEGEREDVRTPLESPLRRVDSHKPRKEEEGCFLMTPVMNPFRNKDTCEIKGGRVEGRAGFSSPSSLL